MLSDKCSLLLSLTSRPTKNLRTTKHIHVHFNSVPYGGVAGHVWQAELTFNNVRYVHCHSSQHIQFQDDNATQTLMLTVNETLLLGDYHSFQFCLSVIYSLLKGTRNSIHWIKISAVRGPHVRLDEVDVFFSKIVNV